MQAHREALRLGRMRLRLDTALALGRLGCDEAAGTLSLSETIRDSVRGSELDGSMIDLRMCP